MAFLFDGIMCFAASFLPNLATDVVKKRRRRRRICVCQCQQARLHHSLHSAL
jgi:hypothetical protein